VVAVVVVVVVVAVAVGVVEVSVELVWIAVLVSTGAFVPDARAEESLRARRSSFEAAVSDAVTSAIAAITAATSATRPRRTELGAGGGEEA